MVGPKMYVMIGLKEGLLKNVEKTTSRESVFVLPGQVFQMPNYFRIVITSPRDTLMEACKRIHAFCDRHTDG